MKTRNLLSALIFSFSLILTSGTLTNAAGPGDLDPTFGNGGKVFTDLGGNNSSINAMVLQSDGKIIVAGSSYNSDNSDIALVRYHSNGSLDSTFGNNGIVTTSLSNQSDVVNDIVLQSDGKIIVAGSQGNSGGTHFVTVRYNSNGSLDSTFGSNGVVYTNLGGDYEQAEAVALQADGKIIIAGYSGPELSTDITLIRYNSNGSLDTSFDNDGYVFTDVGGYEDHAKAIIIQSDGKIAVAGANVLVRYNSNGSLDTSFDSDGIVTTTINNGSEFTDMALQPDGKIVATGHSYDDSYIPDFALARYNDDGSLDTSFDTDGIVTTPIGPRDDFAYAVKLQSDGKIIVAGFIDTLLRNDVALARYNEDGSLDITFDTDGIITTPLGNGYSIATALAVQTDTKIIVAGKGNSTFAVARYLTDGSFDTSFDTDGQVFTDLGNGEDWADAVALQANGQIVVAGARWKGGFKDIAVVRYNNNGSLDPDFGNGGIVVTPINLNYHDSAYDVAIQTDGKIVIVGEVQYENDSFSGSKFVLVRYNSNGSLDTSFDSDGIVITQVNSDYSVAKAIGLQTDGKIVVAGYSADSLGTNFAIVRYNSDGSLDTSFDDDGIATTPITSDSSDKAHDLVIQPNGKIVVVGSSDNNFGQESFALARYNSDGSLDTSFGTEGVVTEPVNGTAYAVALQGNKIVAAGSTYVEDDIPDFAQYFTVVRYNSNGDLDTSFAGDGIATAPFSGYYDTAYGVAVQANDKIVAVGNSKSEQPYFTLIRYHNNGSLDSSFDGDGIVITPFDSFYDSAMGVAIQPDKKIIVANMHNFDFALARYQGDTAQASQNIFLPVVIKR